MKDVHGRTIDYMRISLTDRCNLRCIYCMPEEGVPCVDHDRILRYDQIIRLVRVAAQMGIARIRLTGGEPLVRKGVVNLVRAIHDIEGIRDVSMTTNGILLARFADDLREAGLKRVNISLDSLDPDQYRRITRGGELDAVEEGIQAALRAGFSPVKLNAVAVRSLNQDFLSFAKLSVDRPLHVRFIEYMPIGDSSGVEGCGWGSEDVISCEEIRTIVNKRACAEGLGELVAIEGRARPDGAGPASYYQFKGALGTVGFISPLSRHFCGECNRLRVTAQGGIRPCLFSDQEFDISQALRSGTDNDVRTVLTQALGAKPEKHTEHPQAHATTTTMNAIGG